MSVVGPLADIVTVDCDVCFAPESRHRELPRGEPVMASMAKIRGRWATTGSPAAKLGRGPERCSQ
jgi:hypothetical protein